MRGRPLSSLLASAGWRLGPLRRPLRRAKLTSFSLRGRLFSKYVALLVAVVCLALITNASLEFWFLYQEHKATLIRIQRQQAEAASAKISQFIEQIETQIGWTTQLPWANSTLEQRKIDLARLLRQVPAITELAQLDPAGVQRLRVSRVSPDVLGSELDLSDDPKFLEATAHKRYYGPVYFRHNSEPYMSLALAGARGDAGITVAEINLKFILDVVSQIRVGDRGQAYVVDDRGRLIAHPDIDLVLRGADLLHLARVSSAPAVLAEAAEEPLEVVDGLQGRPVLTAHARISPTGWLVFAELPREEAYAPLYATIERTGLVLLAALLLAALAGMLLARKMVVPIQALQTGAARIGTGDLSQRISIKTGDELEALAAQFNEMAERLQDSYATLERKVETRTSELAQSVNELRALGDVSQAVSSTLNLENVLSTIVEKSVQLSGTHAGAIFVFDRKKEEFVLRATHGMNADIIARIREHRVNFDDPTVAVAFRQYEPVLVPDLRREPLTGPAAIIPGADYRSLLVAPLQRPGETLGLLVVCRRQPGEFPKRTIELLKTFATHSVLAIQNARLFGEIDEKSRQLAIESRHKSSFLANMSHELRTPLNAILGYTELILDKLYGEPPERMHQVLQRIQVNGRHLLGLINDVLDLAKIEAGQLTLSLGEYSIKEVAHQVVTAVEPLAAAKQLELKLDIGAQLPNGRGDERRIAQVLLNLVGNAIKFTDAGKVVIKASASNGSFIVAVSDTGPGISPADHARIFQEFQQAASSPTRKKKGGTGLGLSIARRIIEMHKGRIWLDSLPGKGSTFYFSLPVWIERQEGGS
jgi:signal transduction histidine kinase